MKILLSAILLGLSILLASCSSSPTPATTPVSSDSSESSTEFTVEPVYYEDLIGGTHLYLPMTDGKALISANTTEAGDLYTVVYEEEGDQSPLTLQFDDTGLINRMEKDARQVNITFLGSNNFYVEHIAGDGSIVSEVVDLGEAAKLLDDELITGSGDKGTNVYKGIRARNSTSTYTMSLQCSNGFPLHDARLKLLDTSLRNDTLAFSAGAFLSLQASNATYPINTRQSSFNEWQYFVEETTVDEAIRLQSMNSALNNVCAFQNLLSAGLSTFGITLGGLIGDFLGFTGIACNIRTAVGVYELIRDRANRGLLSNDSDVTALVLLPDGSQQDFRFTPRMVSASTAVRLDWHDGANCYASNSEIDPAFEGAPFNPLTIYRIPNEPIDVNTPTEPETPDAPDEPIDLGDPSYPDIIPPDNHGQSIGFSINGVWARCHNPAGGDSSISTTLEISADGSAKEKTTSFLSTDCEGDIFLTSTLSGTFLLGDYITTAEGIEAREIDYNIVNQISSSELLFPGESNHADCREMTVYDVIYRSQDSLYTSLHILNNANTGFVTDRGSDCQYWRPSPLSSRPNAIDFEFSELRLCQTVDISGDASGESSRNECRL